jgi:hypothetical protein
VTVATGLTVETVDVMTSGGNRDRGDILPVMTLAC